VPKKILMWHSFSADKRGYCNGMVAVIMPRALLALGVTPTTDTEWRPVRLNVGY
jgi:hypothetical protein